MASLIVRTSKNSYYVTVTEMKKWDAGEFKADKKTRDAEK